MSAAPLLGSPRRAIGEVAARTRRVAIWRPLLMIAGGVAVALGMLAVDESTSLPFADLVDVVTARSLLASVAGTMVTATVVVFWIRGLLVGAHSGTIPSRILIGYLGDTYQRSVMGFMVGVFAYLVTVIAALPGDDGGQAPVLAIGVGVVLVVTSLLAIIQSIDAGSRSMHEERILLRIVDEVLSVIKVQYPEHSDSADRHPDPVDGTSHTVWSRHIGWVSRLDVEGMLDPLPSGSVCRPLVRIGELLTPATPVCRVTVPDGADLDVEGLSERVNDAVHASETRSPDTDIALGIRSIVDVALSGLGSGGAGRTTSREAIAHLGAVVRPLVLRDGPPMVWHDDEDRWVVRDQPDVAYYLNVAFEDLTHDGADPLTARMVFGVLDELIEAAEHAGRSDRAELLRRHAELLTSHQRTHAIDMQELTWITGRERVDALTGRDG